MVPWAASSELQTWGKAAMDLGLTLEHVPDTLSSGDLGKLRLHDCEGQPQMDLMPYFAVGPQN